MDYEQGLAHLKELARQTAWYQDFLTYEARLREKLDEERRYGPSQQTSQERARVVAQLNGLALIHLNLSFTDLCLPQAPSPAPSLPVAINKQPSSPDAEAPTLDIGIVIALKEEFREFFSEIELYCQPHHEAETGGYYYRFDYPLAAKEPVYRCVATFVGDMGAVKAGLLTQRLLNRWRPRIMVMLGIAAALDKDVALGDVVVASQVDAYIENAKSKPARGRHGYTFQLSGEIYRTSLSLYNAVSHFVDSHPANFQSWQQACRQDLQQTAPGETVAKLVADGLLREQIQMIEGHLASGPIVGAARAFTDWLKQRDRKYLALEMESAGFMAAVYERAETTRTLILRAISDYGDERKPALDAVGSGALRRYAMRNAIHLLWQLLDARLL